ncbi:SDR family oxidoreductase [Croceicoccus sp. F390]|uniref:SDR family oxidoreductase n=1 Tax=Croceicoccus esteveae TaxID=3075597 RepID=A0ABU2ZKM4_9SPHN|nr:SDR family oxidoreductase [Croceicoccus sp. F390]MDT0575972.1 SDR family oxidoreductase [Croceicoccus sp. F390]
MDLGLQGKKVILTGGSRGIGRAALELFAQEGCDVAFFSRNAEQVSQTVDALSRHGGKVIGEPLDMLDHDAYTDWLTSAADRLGGCDIFVPGVSASGSGATGDWEACFAADIKGTVLGCETLQPMLEKSQAAAIVIMASTAGTETFLMPQAYNALKAALIAYSGQLGQMLGPLGIRVNCVSPGPIKFPGGNWEAIHQAMPELYDATEASFALGRWGGPEEVARTIVFLASPASSYTTGTNVVIDGGYTKRVQF